MGKVNADKVLFNYVGNPRQSRKTDLTTQIAS